MLLKKWVLVSLITALPRGTIYFQLTLPSPSTLTLRLAGLPKTVTDEVDAVGLELLRVQAAQAAQGGLQQLAAPADGDVAGALQVQLHAVVLAGPHVHAAHAAQADPHGAVVTHHLHAAGALQGQLDVVAAEAGHLGGAHPVRHHLAQIGQHQLGAQG
jgi:hypothetical protein